MVTALSIRQPWTELILQGRKTIEVRTWSTQHRGELWLHAGTRSDKKTLQRFGLAAEDLTFGALVGRCELYDCVEFTPETWELWRVRHLNEGPLEKRLYAWILSTPIRVQPRKWKGRLGLMRIDLSDEATIL